MPTLQSGSSPEELGPPSHVTGGGSRSNGQGVLAHDQTEALPGNPSFYLRTVAGCLHTNTEVSSFDRAGSPRSEEPNRA